MRGTTLLHRHKPTSSPHFTDKRCNGRTRGSLPLILETRYSLRDVFAYRLRDAPLINRQLSVYSPTLLVPLIAFIIHTRIIHYFFRLVNPFCNN